MHTPTASLLYKSQISLKYPGTANRIRTWLQVRRYRPVIHFSQNQSIDHGKFQRPGLNTVHVMQIIRCPIASSRSLCFWALFCKFSPCQEEFHPPVPLRPVSFHPKPKHHVASYTTPPPPCILPRWFQNNHFLARPPKSWIIQPPPTTPKNFITWWNKDTTNWRKLPPTWKPSKHNAKPMWPP